jgi:hypothetical protein
MPRTTTSALTPCVTHRAMARATADTAAKRFRRTFVIFSSMNYGGDVLLHHYEPDAAASRR